MGRVTSDVITGMSVTDFTTVGHNPMLYTIVINAIDGGSFREIDGSARTARIDKSSGAQR